mmetsp:Transcript_30525/g.64877  ORF Transcript_30525/g.64877 Transcript_30525/m.64877 type:complete len:89 (+) Transcript_30525:553-819(+)
MTRAQLQGGGSGVVPGVPDDTEREDEVGAAVLSSMTARGRASWTLPKRGPGAPNNGKTAVASLMTPRGRTKWVRLDRRPRQMPNGKTR